MVEKLVMSYIDKLQNKAQLNGGFPDTEAMHIALFGQVAFQYEQNCNEIYKEISKQHIE